MRIAILALFLFGCNNNPAAPEPLQSNDHRTELPVPCCVYPINIESEE